MARMLREQGRFSGQLRFDLAQQRNQCNYYLLYDLIANLFWKLFPLHSACSVDLPPDFN